MSEITDILEQQADLLFENVAGWETRTLQRIGKRIKTIGNMKLSGVKALNNMSIVKQDMDAIIKDLARVTGLNISEVQKMYSEAIENQHFENKALYDFRNKPFIPFSDNVQLQALVRAYSKSTGETMINLSKTKALGFIDEIGGFKNMQDSIYDIFGKATMEVATGTSDFNSAMRSAIERLGGSGVVTHYGSGVNRRLDTVIRQNILWGAKQTSIEYNNIIGEELSCDGIEIDFHSNPRPSHEFMQGMQYSLEGKKTINGKTYESADRALERLSDYGCLHYKTPIILGVTEPRYDDDQLAEMRERDREKKTVDGKTKSGYEWTQDMRRLETEARKEKDIINALKASGNEAAARQHRRRLRAINEKYNNICEQTGLTPQKERMRVYGGAKTAANAAIRNTNTELVYNPNADFSVQLNSLNSKANTGISNAAKKVAELGGKNHIEYVSLIDLDSGEELFFEGGDSQGVGSIEFWKYIKENKDKKIAFIHNHNTDGYFSETDMRTLLNNRNIKIFGAIRIDGVKYLAEKTVDLDGIYYFDPLFEEELKDLNKQVRNGIITAGERTHRREEIIVDGLLRKYTKGLVEIDGRK